MACGKDHCSCKQQNVQHTINQTVISTNQSLFNTQMAAIRLSEEMSSLKVAHQVVRIRFKNNRKVFYRCSRILPEAVNPMVVAEENNGIDIGTLIESGDCAIKTFRKEHPEKDPSNLNRIIRIASDSDISLWLDARKCDSKYLKIIRDFANKNSLPFHIADIETRADKKFAKVFLSDSDRISIHPYKKIFESLINTEISIIDFQHVSSQC